MRHSAGADAEQLIDLQTDPHETRNAAADPQNAQALTDHRRRHRT